MGATVLTNAGIYIGGTKAARAFNRAMIDGDAAMIDVTGFSCTSREFRKGVLTGNFSASGFYDDGVNAALDVEWRSGLGNVFTALEDDSEGSVAWLMFGMVAQLSQGANIDGASTMVMTGQSKGSPAVARGKVSLRNDAVAATVLGTAVHLTPATALQAVYANIHCYSVSVGGTPAATVTIESDNAVGFPTPTTIGTVTPNITAVGGQLLTMPGPFTDDWFRAKVVIASPGTFGLAVALSVR